MPQTPNTVQPGQQGLMIPNALGLPNQIGPQLSNQAPKTSPINWGAVGNWFKGLVTPPQGFAKPGTPTTSAPQGGTFGNYSPMGSIAGVFNSGMSSSIPNASANTGSSTDMNTLAKKAQENTANLTGNSSVKPNGSSTPPADTNPYSFTNYYAAHPEAKPGYVDPNASGNTGNTGGTFVGGPQYGGLTEEQKKNVVNPGSNTQGAATYRDASGAIVLNPNGQNYQNQAVTPGATNPPPQFTINGLFPSVASSLANLAGTQSPQYQNAQTLSQNAVQQLEALKAGAATDPFAGGRTDAAAYSGYQGALANARSAAESALAQEVQGLQQTAGTATTQQLAQQSGLGAAGSLTQPQQAGPTNVPFNPATGQYGNPAVGAYGANGLAGVGALNTQMSQGAAVQQMSGTQAQAQALAKNLGNLLDSSNINPSNGAIWSSTWNGVMQWINNQTGDPQYQNFANLINEISSRYANILNQSGGTPTDQSTLSHSIINSLAGGASIQQVLGQLDKNASDSINALKGAAGTNVVNAGGQGTQGGQTSAGGHNFVQVNGKWVAQ